MIEWAFDELAKRGMRVTGEATVVHERPWSRVARIPTDGGITFVKTTLAEFGNEMPVTAILARVAPSAVTRVIAHDDAQRLLLMEDAGERLRSIIERDRDVGHWRGLLRRYAEVQIAATPHAAELVAAGCPDLRAGALAARFEEAIADDALIDVAGAHDDMAKHLPQLRAFLPRVREWDRALGAIVPATIQHDDLHDGQVFIRDGHARFLDWGDAVVSPPFYSLVVAERSIAYTFDLAADAPALLRLRAEYLEPFTASASRARLDDAVRLALVLGRLVRALTWTRVMRALPPEQRDGEAVAGWFELFLEGAATL